MHTKKTPNCYTFQMLCFEAIYLEERQAFLIQCLKCCDINLLSFVLVFIKNKPSKYGFLKCPWDSSCNPTKNSITFATWVLYLVTSRAFWTFACTEPSKSAPIFFSNWVRRTKSQSCKSSLWMMMKSTRVSRNMLKTYKQSKCHKKEHPALNKNNQRGGVNNLSFKMILLQTV